MVGYKLNDMTLDLCHVPSEWSRDPIFAMGLEEELDWGYLCKHDPFFSLGKTKKDWKWLRGNLRHIPFDMVKDWDTQMLIHVQSRLHSFLF